MPHANILLLGIDGARHGYWVTAASDVDSSSLVFELTRDLSPLFTRAARNETLIVIDVPIGILSGSAAGAGRVCDREARRAVGPRRQSSVFTPPSRGAFGAATRVEASERNSNACGLGVGCQPWGILRRIEAVDAMMSPVLEANVREGHPEVSFALLKGSFLEWSKKSAEGRRERLELLREHGSRIDVDAERLRLGRGNVAGDDIIDAAAMLVTARRIVTGAVTRLGGAIRDSRGVLMQIWA